MTDYETQLRDEFAKIAFEAIVKDWLANPLAYKKTFDEHGNWAYSMADKAMQARKESQQ